VVVSEYLEKGRVIPWVAHGRSCTHAAPSADLAPAELIRSRGDRSFRRRQRHH
jgi:hypothetical protein